MALPVPLIVGCGRSGTTLLRSMLDAHPDLAVINSSNVLTDFARRSRRAFRVEEFVAYLTSHPGFPRFGVPAEAVREELERVRPASTAEAVRACFALAAAGRGKPRWGEKGPEYVMDLDRVATLLPEARFLHIVRDGRDVAAALVDARWGPTDLRTAAGQWAVRVERGRQSGRALGYARYHEVRYDELVAEPEVTLLEICRFLDIEYDQGMLDYSGSVAAATIADKRFAASHSRLLLPPTPGLRDWRRDLTASQVAMVEAMAARTLIASGYEFSGCAGGAAPRRFRRRAVARRLVVRLRHRLLLGERVRRARRHLRGRVRR
jgi:hypothetical protein